MMNTLIKVILNCLLLVGLLASGIIPKRILAQEDKRSEELRERMEQLGPNEFIPVIILLKDHVSLQQLEDLTLNKQKSERRQAVVTYLKNFANRHQKGLLEELYQKQEEELAKDIKARWITNVVIAKVKNTVVEEIEQRSDVSSIVLDKPFLAMGANTWNVEKIQAHKVWSDIGFHGDGVLLAVLDTGIDYDHSDLKSNMWQNLGEDYDNDGHTLEYVSGTWQLDPGDLNNEDDDGNGYIDDLVGYDLNTPDHDPMDDNDHGTHVAGTIAGDGTGGTQTGVAPEANLMALKIWDQYGWGTPSQCWEAFEYAVDNGTDVINVSGGWPDLWITLQEKATFRQICDNAVTAGVTVVTIVHNDWPQPPNVPHNVRTPGSVPSVISLGATDANDIIASFSSRGPVTWQDVPGYYDFPYPPGLLKPDVCAPGVNITSTKRGGGYEGGWDGTSMAAPAASGSVALMLEASINTLLPTTAKNILEATALDLGIAGKDSVYGSGRIDAYQAVLLALAYDNKSTISAATAYNSPRTLARGKNSTATLHEVFYSGRYDASSDGWEVFYRRSSDNGASWDLTKRISAGDSHNRRQCISVTDEGNDDGVHVVWQRKKDNGKYQVVYRKSTDTGTSWQNAVLLADDVSCSSSQSVGPMPVITSITSGSVYKLIVVWVTSSGLRYRIYNNGQWENTGALDDGSYNSYVWFPSIMGKGSFASLTYDTRYYGVVYSRIYNGTSWSSANDVTAGSGTIYDRHSQIAIRISNNPIAAWCAQRSGDSYYRILFRSGFSDNTWSSWFEEFDPETGKHCYYPSLTDYSGNGQYGISIVYHTSDNEIKMKKWVSGEWQPYTLNSNGIFANITYESVPNSIPKIIWTDQAGPPYQLVLSSQYLSKSQLLANGVNHRRAVFENKTDNTCLAIEIGEVTVNTNSEDIFSIDFPPVDIFQKITINNIDDAMYYLIPDTVILPQDVKQLKLNRIIYTTSPYDSVGPEPGTAFKNFDLELILHNFRLIKKCLHLNDKLLILPLTRDEF